MSEATNDTTEQRLTTRDFQSLRFVFSLLWKNRRFIFRIMAIVTIISSAYVFLMPQTFTSTASLLPPQKEDSGNSLADLLSGNMQLFDLGATLGFGGRPADVFVDILKSRTIAESLITKYQLAEKFGISGDKAWRLAIEPLQDATFIETAKDGLITISVTMKTPYLASQKEIDSVKLLAANITNDYIFFLDKVNRTKIVSKAKNSRRYIEEQLHITRLELDTAYTRLVAFQNQNKLLSLDKQLEGMIRYAGEVKTKLVEAEIELGYGEKDLKKSSRLLQDAQARVDELQKHYDQFLFGNESSEGKDYSVALVKLPSLARELANLLRDLKILEEVNIFLNKQYYKEKVQEARDLPTVQVLDAAIPAIKRSSPMRMMWIAVTVFLSFIGACILVVFKESTASKTATTH